jgi:ribosomal protein S18 acetylase RimI-like enzyme
MNELPTIDGYTLTHLTPENGPLMQALAERCADYFELVTGCPPGPAEAQALFTALPAGKGYEDKMVIGVFASSHELVGVLDVVRDYPELGKWYLGLLMLEPARRGQGLGERLYRAFEQWAAASGARAIRLSVAGQNGRAYRFWRRLGFVELERRPPARFGAKESVMIIMERALPIAITSDR